MTITRIQVSRQSFWPGNVVRMGIMKFTRRWCKWKLQRKSRQCGPELHRSPIHEMWPWSIARRSRWSPRKSQIMLEIPSTPFGYARIRWHAQESALLSMAWLNSPTVCVWLEEKDEILSKPITKYSDPGNGTEKIGGNYCSQFPSSHQSLLSYDEGPAKPSLRNASQRRWKSS